MRRSLRRCLARREPCHKAPAGLLHRAADPAGLRAFTMDLQDGVPIEAIIAAIVGSQEGRWFSRITLGFPGIQYAGHIAHPQR